MNPQHKTVKGKKRTKNHPALTLIELLIVVTTLAILSVLALVNWRGQLNKAKDAQRKKDLNRLRIAFEDYYNDHGCYPPSNILDNCGSNQLQPYLNSIPCDPETGTPYYYVVDEDNPSCYQKFKILTSLKNSNDKSIKEVGCNYDNGCGYSNNSQIYNYGVSSTNTSLANPSPSPSPTPSPTPSPSPSQSPPPYNGNYACDPQGICNYYDNPKEANCPITFDNPNCNNQCSNPSYRCSQ